MVDRPPSRQAQFLAGKLLGAPLKNHELPERCNGCKQPMLKCRCQNSNGIVPKAKKAKKGKKR